MSYRQNPSGPVVVTSPGKSNTTELVRDFLVDGLGILLPGLGFLFACLPAVLIPLTSLILVVDKHFFPVAPAPDHSKQLIEVSRFSPELSKWLSELPKLSEISAWKYLGNTASSFHLELFLALVGVSYVVGHLLFRQDVKEPDKKSFIRTHSPKLSKLDAFRRGLVRLFGSEARFPIYWGGERLAVEAAAASERRPVTVHRLWSRLLDACWPVIPVFIERGAKENGLVITGEDKKFDGMVRPFEGESDDLCRVPVEYPYHFLFEYLSERGFPHLAQLVPWRGAQGRDLPGRSKHFINMLKCNIQHHGSALSHLISKNEAHIRLASSVWYAASYIARFSVVGVALSVVAYLLSSDMHLARLTCAALPTVTLIMAIIVQGAIEKSLHYQRSREIFLVLHVAALVGREKRDVLYGIQNPTAWTRLKAWRTLATALVRNRR